MFLRPNLTERPRVFTNSGPFIFNSMTLRRIFLAFFSLLFWAFLSIPAAFSAGAGKLDQEVADLRRVQESSNRILADTAHNVTAVKQEIQLLKGSIEEVRHFFQEASGQNEKLLRDFDMRLTGMEEKLSLYESQLRDFLATGGKGSKVTGPALSGEEGTLYKKALGEINIQNYKGAIILFDQFLKKYPTSSMADNAQYWKGEALYALKRFPEAVLEFQKILKRFPKSEKVPGSILKQGYCFYEAKEYLDAKAFLQKVATEFPRSEEAVKAKEKIRQIDAILARPAGKPAEVTPAANPVHPGTVPGGDLDDMTDLILPR